MKGTGSDCRGNVDLGGLSNLCVHVGFEKDGGARLSVCANITEYKSLTMPLEMGQGMETHVC